jgi:threonine/homoserine/homoserine lactone efflux protein
MAHMNKNTISIVLLVVGVVLLVLGLQEYGAFGSRVSRALGQGPSERAWFLMIGGAVCAGFGALWIFRK